MGRVKTGKYLSTQAKEIINSCRQFCEEERHNYTWNLETHGNCQHTLVPLSNPIKRTSRACKVSRRTIVKLKQELEETKGVDEEDKESKEAIKKKSLLTSEKINRKSTQMLDGADLCIVRKTVHKLYEQFQKVPSLQAVHESVHAEIDFPWGQKTLRSTLNDLGFRWKVTENKTKYLMEKSQIITNRSQFIRAVRSYRREGYEIVYIGETWLQQQSQPYLYSYQHLNESATEIDKRMEDRTKFSILHAGCKNGFIPNCLMVTESNFDKRAKSDDTRHKEYEHWIRHQLLPNLPPKSVVVQSSDPHHCVLSEIVPTSTSSIDDLKLWLSNNYITFTHDILKTELLSLVRMNKPKPEFRSDLIIKHAGFHTLHLPSLHVDLDPIELIWPSLKSYINAHNYSNICNDTSIIQNLIMDGCLQTGRDQWHNAVAQTIRTEDEYCRRDTVIELIVERLVIGVYESGCSSDYTSSDSDSDSEGYLNLPQMKRNISEAKPKGKSKKGTGKSLGQDNCGVAVAPKKIKK